MVKQEWFSVLEAAHYAECHRQTIANALRDRELQGVQRLKGGRWKTKLAWVDAWLAGDTIAA